MAIVYHTDGTSSQAAPRNGKYFESEELQAIVGGYIEVLRISAKNPISGKRSDCWIVMNEEGKLIGLPPNPQATQIIRDAGYWDCVVGDAVLCACRELR